MMSNRSNVNLQTSTIPNYNPANREAIYNSIVPPYPNQNDYTELDNIPYYERTEYIPAVPGTSNVPTTSGIAATESSQAGPMENAQSAQQQYAPYAAPQPGMSAGSLPSQEEVYEKAPIFSVPTNPILPPGYQEVLDYGNLQYLNGFLRTQIGKYIRVQQLVGSNVIEDRYGYLVGVGINYILLQEISTGNILVLDFYNIKYAYIYYTKPDLPSNGAAI